MNSIKVGFCGAGRMAQNHAFALAALPFYYSQCPQLGREFVTARSLESARRFAERFGFREGLELEEMWRRSDLDAVFLIGPNKVHFSNLERAIELGVRRIYVEKPLCIGKNEERALWTRSRKIPSRQKIQVGFQFLQMASFIRAWRMVRDGFLGDPVSFGGEYLHSGYLSPEYRKKRAWRLESGCGGGALGDLGSHVLSMLVALLGSGIEVVAATQSGAFEDVPPDSDLCTTVLLKDTTSGAMGSVTASRISAGAGDYLRLEIRGTRGALRLSTERPDVLESYRTGNGWKISECCSDYSPESTYPAAAASGGWLRSLLHAHAVFFEIVGSKTPVPDLQHALSVQKILRRSVECLRAQRQSA